MSLQAWIKEQNTTDTTELLRRIHSKPIMGYSESPTVIEQDKVSACAERLAKSIAQIAGITKSDCLADMDDKLQAMINIAATANKPLAVYHAAQFWIAYFACKKIDGEGVDSKELIFKTPVYGDSPAELLGVTTITGDDIERILRMKL